MVNEIENEVISQVFSLSIINAVNFTIAILMVFVTRPGRYCHPLFKDVEKVNEEFDDKDPPQLLLSSCASLTLDTHFSSLLLVSFVQSSSLLPTPVSNCVTRKRVRGAHIPALYNNYLI